MIRLDGVSLELGDFRLRDIDLTVATGEYFVLLGPTGAGKTVLLEATAGLVRLSRGSIFLGDEEVTGRRPEQRGVSIVYQDYSLFPHLNARDNILFGLRLKKASPAACAEALDWIAGLLGIGHLLERWVTTLSGGERQKLSLARALVTKPSVLLLDEPLSALDPQTREQMRDELRRLHAGLNMTIIHVTHDFEEALSLADRIAVLGEGSLQQVGPPEEVYRRPASVFVAHFMMVRNLLAGEVYRAGDGSPRFRGEGLDLAAPPSAAGPCHAAIRPEDITLAPAGETPAAENRLTGTVAAVSDRGPLAYVTVRTPVEFTLLLAGSRHGQRPAPGDEVVLTFPAAAVHLIRDV
jgi:ABC-type sugar transport system ATPase subunit